MCSQIEKGKKLKVLWGANEIDVDLKISPHRALNLIIKRFHHFSPNLSNSTHDSPDQTDDKIQI
jgi:hypothetical protein